MLGDALKPVADTGSSAPGLQIVMVCEANVCRSALGAFVLGRSPELRVSSAGMNAREGSALCEVAAEKISVLPGGPEYTSAFRSHPVDWDEAERADLVLTATGDLRGQLLANQPRLLRVAFTVLEALALMAEPLDLDELDLAQRDGIAAVLFGRRGTIAGPTAQPRRWKGTARHDGFDIPDGHQFRRKSHHQATVDEAVHASGQLRRQLLVWQLAMARAGLSGPGHG